MARSNTFIYNRTANEIIESALRRARIIPVEQSISDIDRNTALEALNNMVSRWQTIGYNIWRQEEYVLFLDQGKRSYLIGPTGDRVTLASGFINDALTANVSAGLNVLPISTTIDFTGSDNILTFDPSDTVAGWVNSNGTLTAITAGLRLTTTAAATEAYTEYTFTSDVTVGTNYFFQVSIDALTTTTARFEVYEVGTSTTLIATSASFATTGDQILDFVSNESTVILRIVSEDLTGAGVLDFGNVRLHQTNTGEEIGVRINASLREWNIVKRVLTPTTLELVNNTVNAMITSASVYAFKSKPPRPLKLRDYRSQTNATSDEIPVTTWSRQEYLKQTVKDTQGQPTQAYYQQKLDNGVLYVWQTASDVEQLILFSGDVPVQIFVDNADNPDFPSEWFDALSWNLAAALAPEYGVPPQRYQIIKVEAAGTLEEAKDFDEDNASLFMGPDFNV